MSHDVPWILIEDERGFEQLLSPDRPAILLAASVPYERSEPSDLRNEERAEWRRRNAQNVAKYVQDATPDRIRLAVEAFTVTALQRGARLVFGAHPAISPMVLYAAQQLAAPQDTILIFQSDLFRDELPSSTLELAGWDAGRLIYTPRVDEGGPSRVRAASLERMRSLMVSVPGLCGAVFIGGMEGVETEGDLFRKKHAGALPCYAVASTGSAARQLWGRADGAFAGTLKSELAHYPISYHLLASHVLDDMGIREPDAPLLKAPATPGLQGAPEPESSMTRPAVLTGDELRQHRDHLQGIVNRMADNSFKLKSWCIALVSALLGLALKPDDKGGIAPTQIALLAVLPTIIFALLDAYYLALERTFRDRYNDTAPTSAQIKPGPTQWAQIWTALTRPATWILYAVLLVTEGLVGAGLLAKIVAALHLPL